MSNRRSQHAPLTLHIADQASVRAGRLILSVIVIVISIIVAVAILPTRLADWAT